jgi:hypothetical protein
MSSTNPLGKCAAVNVTYGDVMQHISLSPLFRPASAAYWFQQWSHVQAICRHLHNTVWSAIEQETKGNPGDSDA